MNKAQIRKTRMDEIVELNIRAAYAIRLLVEKAGDSTGKESTLEDIADKLKMVRAYRRALFGELNTLKSECLIDKMLLVLEDSSTEAVKEAIRAHDDNLGVKAKRQVQDAAHILEAKQRATRMGFSFKKF